LAAYAVRSEAGEHRHVIEAQRKCLLTWQSVAWVGGGLTYEGQSHTTGPVRILVRCSGSGRHVERHGSATRTSSSGHPAEHRGAAACDAAR